MHLDALGLILWRVLTNTLPLLLLYTSTSLVENVLYKNNVQKHFYVHTTCKIKKPFCNFFFQKIYF